MLRWFAAIFLILHGIVFVFLAPESWVAGDADALWIGLGAVALFALGLAAWLVVRRRDWRRWLTAGAGVSLLQLLVFFEMGLIVGVAINLALLGVANRPSARLEPRPT